MSSELLERWAIKTRRTHWSWTLENARIVMIMVMASATEIKLH